MSNDFRRDIVHKMISSKKYGVITDYARILHKEKGPLQVHSYDGDHVRVYKESDTTHVLCPCDMTVVLENAVTEAITSGSIFDDADSVARNTNCMMGQMIPSRGLTNRGFENPTKLNTMTQIVMSKLDPDTSRVEVSDVDLENGKNFINDIVLKKPTCLEDTKDIVNNYCDDNDLYSTDDMDLRKDIATLTSEIESINDVSPEDSITDDDYDPIDVGDVVEEAFFAKRPKKLKPIPRDIIPYITIELNNIQDANDQAMLSGYTCSKLELVDFYLNVIDQNDVRYIVPHTRDYLVNMQNELNKLLAAILKVRPINRNDRVWKVGVNYPEGWRG